MRFVHILLLLIVTGVFLVAWLEVKPELDAYDPAHSAGVSREDWKNRVHLAYWEKWGNFEAEACQAMVDEFNRSQNKIFVHYIRTSEVNRKSMLAIVGHDPPDVLGLWAYDMSNFADGGALLPLDDLMKKSGLTEDYYTPGYLKLGQYKGKTYGLPTAPATAALFYNKEYFRKKAPQLVAAGLDPNRAPRTIEELDRYADVLSEFGSDGKPVVIGFLPCEPFWWNWAWGYHFGGQLFDANDGRVTADDAGNVRAMKWVKRLAEHYGREKLLQFRAGFGNFDSPHNAFIDGRVAMEMQGVWFPGFISRHRPHLDYGVAPFPAAGDVPGPVSGIDSDFIVIPRGCRHLEEAWTFVHWVQTRGLLILCRQQGKHLPIRNPPADFRAGHPNPYLRIFEEVGELPQSYPMPTSVIWMEYKDRMNSTFEAIWNWVPPESKLQGLTGKAREQKIEALCDEYIRQTLGNLRRDMQIKLDVWNLQNRRRGTE